MGVSITVVIPTIGRDTLRRAVDSCLGADELLVVTDGPLDLPFPHLSTPTRGNVWGHSVRNWAADKITTSHVVCLDDDDVLVPGALDVIRTEVAKSPRSLHIFQVNMGTLGLGLVWKRPWGLVDRNVTTGGLVYPSGSAGVWGDVYNGDLLFAQSTAKRCASVRWVPHVVEIARPEGMVSPLSPYPYVSPRRKP